MSLRTRQIHTHLENINRAKKVPKNIENVTVRRVQQTNQQVIELIHEKEIRACGV